MDVHPILLWLARAAAEARQGHGGTRQAVAHSRRDPRHAIRA